MAKRYQKKPEKLMLIAQQRVYKLFKEADSAFAKNTAPGKILANRYVELARKIAMKFKLRLPKAMKMSFCKNCFSYIKPGKNCTVRLTNSKLVYHCLECNGYMRYPYILEKRQKKAKKPKKQA